MSDTSPTAEFPTAEELGSALPQYEIEERISVGEESAIYRARQPALDRSVMIRVMAEPPTPEAATRLMERLRGRARIVHPRIVAVYDFGRAISGHLYLVTEHVNGRVLSDLVQERQVPPKLAYSYALQVCDILSMLHEQGLKHGALNSRTVLVDEDGQLKITGVGMSVTPRGEISWLHESEASISGDITDLGALLHEMFGREPLPEDGRVSRNLPPAFGAVIRRCVQLETTRRYTSASEVKEALVQALKTQQQGASAKAGTSTSAPATAPSPAPAAMRAAAAPAARPAPVSAPSVPQVSHSHEAAPPAAYAPPRYAPGRPPPPVVRPQPSFMKKLDDFLWACLRASLHLSIFLVAAVVMLIFYVMKDKIVLKDPNDPDSAREEAALPGQMLGKLPEAPQLPQAPVTVPSSPITLPPPAPSADPLASLKAEYRNAVQSEATAALDKVRLNELPFFQKELQRLQSGESVPDTDEPNLPAALKRLRDDYRSKKATLEK